MTDNLDLYGQLVRAAHDDLAAGLRRAGDALNQLHDLAQRIGDDKLVRYTLDAGSQANTLGVVAERVREHVHGIGREVPL